MLFYSDSETYKYVFHPINAYQLLKRTAKYIPKLTKTIPDFQFKFPLPSLSDAYAGASLGLADILEYYALDPFDIANGHLKHHGDDSCF